MSVFKFTNVYKDVVIGDIDLCDIVIDVNLRLSFRFNI